MHSQGGSTMTGISIHALREEGNQRQKGLY